MIFPFYWMLRSSVMTDHQIMTTPLIWFPSEYHFSNFFEAFTAVPFARYFMNSGVIVAAAVTGAVFSAGFIAFGFARLSFPGRNVCFAVLMSTLMIPQTVLMIPQFIMWTKVGGFNTFVPLILPAFFGSAFNVFLMMQFYRGIPKDYDEAALVDGASYPRIWWSVLMPMSKPALCSVGVFAFMHVWNDFMGPLLYLDKDELKTVALGLQAFIGQYDTQWNLLMAAAVMAVVPMVIVFFAAQRYFIEGITFTGVKG
jgi:multiple sugar transport system permease protein